MGDRLVYNNNGTYWTYLGRMHGKQHRASTGIRSQAPTAAERRALLRQAEEIAGTLRTAFRARKAAAWTPPQVNAPCPTLAAYAPVWEAQHGKLQRGYEGRVSYRLKALVDAFGAYTLDALTPAVIHQWRVQRLEAGAAPRTINRDVDTLKGILNTAVPDFLAASPLSRMASLKAAPPITATLNAELEKKLLAELGPEEIAIFLVALDSLVRLGDVLSLRWADVNLDEATARVNESKHGRTYHTPLSTRAVEALRVLYRDNTAPHDLVFLQCGGDHKRHSSIFTQRLKRQCAKLGIPWGRRSGGLTFHAATRHTGATRLAAAGVDLRTIQELGGWSNLNMLQRYVHPASPQLRAAVERIRIVD